MKKKIIFNYSHDNWIVLSEVSLKMTLRQNTSQLQLYSEDQLSQNRQKIKTTTHIRSFFWMNKNLFLKYKL
jgi:hypothetical protein